MIVRDWRANRQDHEKGSLLGDIRHLTICGASVITACSSDDAPEGHRLNKENDVRRNHEIIKNKKNEKDDELGDGRHPHLRRNSLHDRL